MTIDNYSIVLNSSGEHGKINKSGAIAEKKEVTNLNSTNDTQTKSRQSDQKS